MIAKIVVHERTRDAACESLARACAATDIYPVKTNAPFLWRALDDGDFRAGHVHTGFIAAKGEALLPPTEPTEDMIKQAAAGLLVQEYYGAPTMLSVWDDDILSELQPDPWHGILGFRVNTQLSLRVTVAVDGKTHSAELPSDWRYKPIVGEPVDGGIAMNDSGLSFLAALPRTDGSAHGPASSGSILSPMPGKIIAVDVTQGQTVTKGQKLLTLEAMKMEHSLTAPFDGVVAELNAAAGAQVQVEALLARIEPKPA